MVAHEEIQFYRQKAHCNFSHEALDLQLFECVLIHLFFSTVDSEGIVKNLTVSKYLHNFSSYFFIRGLWSQSTACEELSLQTAETL